MTKFDDTSTANAHTPTPWRYVDDSTPAEKEMKLEDYYIESADGAFDIANLIGNKHDARRICAAVNACEGISTKALERGIIDDLLSALKEAREEIEHWHSDMLTLEERRHPRGNGWARVHDRISAAIAKAAGRAA